MKETSVLFLDDEEFILTSVKRLFVGESFDVATAMDPQEAFAIMADKKIKVVISDERMPHISGVDFLRKIKEHYPDTVRILLTGYADVAAAQCAINIGEVYRFINKPWNNDELKQIICQAIEHYDLVAENKRLFNIASTKNQELEVLNKKLKNMYEMQKEFTSTVSHELRTPLASIKTAIDVVVGGSPGQLTQVQKSFLDKAKFNVDRLGRLIDSVLDLSKLESGKMALNFNFDDLGEIIKEVVGNQEVVAQQKKIYLKANVAQAFPKISIDRDKISQVLYNLVHNAIKFTDTGGVVVSLINNEQENNLRVCVEDSGKGIKPEDVPRLFQKFQQLDLPVARRISGTGLGLAICKEIIRQHGGKIWVESEFGKGSRFCFTLSFSERRNE